LNDTVVRELYEAAAGITPWSHALDGLYRELKVRQMQLLTVDKTNGALVRSDQPTCMDSLVFDAILEYVREYHRHDPHVTYTSSMPVGVVVNTATVFPIDTYRSHPFYQDYWAAYGVRELLASKIAEDDRYVVMLGMSRTRDLPQYTAADVQLLERYVGHLAAAYRIVRHLGAVQATAQAGLALIEASARPMLLLEENLRIVTINLLARKYLASSSLLYAEGSVLRCRSVQGTTELRRGLQELRMSAPVGIGDTPSRRVALRLEEGKLGRERVLCSLWAMQPASTMSAFGPTSVALLTIAPLDSKSFADPVFVGSMFDLTPSEAKVAIALVAGQDLRSIAKGQRVSLETVRTQLKSIFAKTATHRQSDLIALLLRVTAV
jgi:DNA-binding CsgD family transcriptional regulator